MDGYTTAMQKAEVITHNECMNNAKSVQPGPDSNARLQQSLNLCVLSHSIRLQSRSIISSRPGQVYKNPLNERIPPEFAMEYVRDDLSRDKTPNPIAGRIDRVAENDEYSMTMAAGGCSAVRPVVFK